MNWLRIVHNGGLRGCVARYMLRHACSSAGVVTFRDRAEEYGFVSLQEQFLFSTQRQDWFWVW